MMRNVSGTPQESAPLDPLQLVQRGNALHNEAVFAMLTGAMAWCRGLLRRGKSPRGKDVCPSQGRTQSSFSDLAGPNH